MGSTLRAMVWGSFFNLALSVTGKTKGFWAAKVTSVGKLLIQYPSEFWLLQWPSGHALGNCLLATLSVHDREIHFADALCMSACRKQQKSVVCSI